MFKKIWHSFERRLKFLIVSALTRLLITEEKLTSILLDKIDN